MDTFRQAAATEDMSVYNRMFGDPVHHQLDVGALAEAELEPSREEKKPSPARLREKTSSKPPSGPLADKPLRQSLYNHVGGVPAKQVREHVTAALLGSTNGGLFSSFRLPSHVAPTGGSVTVDGMLHPRLEAAVRRSLGAATSERDEVENTTVFRGGLVPHVGDGQITLLGASKSESYCDVTGLCVNDDDYVALEDGSAAVPVTCGEGLGCGNRALADIVAVLQESNAAASGEVVDPDRFRFRSLTDNDVAALNIVGRSEPPARGGHPEQLHDVGARRRPGRPGDRHGPPVPDDPTKHSVAPHPRQDPSCGRRGRGAGARDSDRRAGLAPPRHEGGAGGGRPSRPCHRGRPSRPRRRGRPSRPRRRGRPSRPGRK